jgi:Zn-dependent metalloprotease
MRILLTAIALLFISVLSAQFHNATKIEPGADWYRYTGEPISAKGYLDKLQQNGLDLRFAGSHQDQLGFVHYTAHQYFDGFRIAAAELKFHEQNGELKTFNGYIIGNIEPIPARITVSATDAIQIALQDFPAVLYAWDDHVATDVLRRVTQNPEASHYPVPEAFWYSAVHRPSSKDLVLAWKFEVFAQEPFGKHLYYIDAQSGIILESFSTLCTQGNPVQGTAETRYHGTRSFVTDSLAPNQYRLHDHSRGGGIETYDLAQSSFLFNAKDFIDDDNYWDQKNAQQNEVANDVHWGAQVSYDYFKDNHSLESFDGNNSPIISYVHMGHKYINAFWTGSYMAFGDGDSASGYHPLTTVDVVAHELTHGVTGNSARLVYRNESGALNESFSDIFGKAVEWEVDSANFSWIIGKHFTPNGRGIRNMEFPKLHNNPNTYKGQFWYTGTADNGGVHWNSGVQNKWFQLLVEGGSGVNDRGDTFSVQGLGFDKALQVAFRNLYSYLGVNSQYPDARIGALLAAEDIFGQCSPEVQSVAHAWYAVGLGTPLQDGELQFLSVEGPNTACGLTAAESVTISLLNNSCLKTIPAGTKIPVVFQIDSGSIILDTITISAPWPPNTAISQTLQQTADLSQTGQYTLTVWFDAIIDSIQVADTATKTVTNKLLQNVDVGMDAILGPADGCFLGLVYPQIRIRHHGCNALPAGTEIPVVVMVQGGQEVRDTVTLTSNLNPNATRTITLTKPIEISGTGTHTLSAWTEFPADSFTSNDKVSNFKVKSPVVLGRGSKVGFSHLIYSPDTMLISSGNRAEVKVDIRARMDGPFGLFMTGGTVAPRANYAVPNDTNHWDINNNSRGRACFCIDATNTAELDVSFYVRQTYTPFHQIISGQELQYSSILRLTADGIAVSPTLRPTTYDLDTFTLHAFDLSAFAGTRFELCFETKNLANSTTDPNKIGDNAFINKIRIGPASVGIADEPRPILTVHPNPASGVVVLTGENLPPDGWRLWNVLGQEVELLITNRSTSSILINISHLPAGQYLLQHPSVGHTRIAIVR